jgi:xylulokinase
MAKVIGLDIGTQGTKAALIDIERGILGTAETGYKPSHPKPRYAEQWPQVWERAVYKVLSELIEKTDTAPEEIEAVSISSLYGGSGIPVNEKIEPTYPCLIWMDRRATDEVEWVKKHIDLDRLYEVTGNYVDSYYGFTKILWLKNKEPEVWTRTKYLLPPNAYVIYRLTGEIAVDYSSAGNIGGVFDVKNRRWSAEMLGQLGIPESYMPERLVASSEVVGKLHAEGASRTGLREGTPIVAGGVDAPVATLAAGAFEPETHVAMVGTSMCWGFITPRSNLSKGLVSMPYVYKPMDFIYSFGGAITAGAVVSWFVEQFGGSEKEAARLLGSSEYTLLEDAARKVPAGSGGLITLPYFMGERNPIWDPYASGTVVGLNLSHGRAHLYRSMLEGVAYSLRHNMEEVAGKLKLAEELILVGGAAKSDLWVEIFADVTGYTIRTIKEDVEAPLGDALLAALAVGLIDDPSLMKNWFTLELRGRPRNEHREIYDEGFAFYKELYENLAGTMGKMAAVNW